MPSRRLAKHPLTTFRRGAPTTFYHDGRPVEGFADEPIAVALYARGARVLSRSMRYHRARGYFCGVGQCTHCFVRLNGVPNVRSCEASCEKLAWVEGQNAFPNVNTDLLAAADVAFPSYVDAHHAFIRPTFLKPVYTRVIRHMAGFGRASRAPVEQSFRHEAITTDVLVVGGGPAGLGAALAASGTGLHVTLVERDTHLGGRCNELPTPFHATAPEAPRTEGKEWVGLERTRLEHQNVRILTGMRLLGVFEGMRLAAATRTAIVDIHARAMVFAPGAFDGYRPFPGSDRAGVLLASGALRLLNTYGVLPGEDVAIVGASREGLLLARDLLACGARVKALVDERPPPKRPDPLAEDVRRLGVAVRWNTKPKAIVGRKEPRALVLPDERVACDAVVLAPGRVPAAELFQQAGCRLTYDAPAGGFRPVIDANLETNVPQLYAAGSALRVADEWASYLSGKLAGRSALHALSGLVDEAPWIAAREAHEAHLRRLGFAQLVEARA